MAKARPRVSNFAVAVALVVYYLLHQDVWLWSEPQLVLGLPAGLAYHLAYCVGASLLMLALLRVRPLGREGGR
jgi:hypothetical protein